MIPTEPSRDLSEIGEVFVFARDSSFSPDGSLNPAPPWRQWHLSSLVGATLEERLIHSGTDDRLGYAYLKLAATAGSLALRTASPWDESNEDGLVVPVIKGWRTEIYLDCTSARQPLRWWTLRAHECSTWRLPPSIWSGWEVRHCCSIRSGLRRRRRERSLQSAGRWRCHQPSKQWPARCGPCTRPSLPSSGAGSTSIPLDNALQPFLRKSGRVYPILRCSRNG